MFAADIPSGHITFTDDGTLLFVNAEAASLLGFAQDELVGKRLETVMTVATKIFNQTHFFPMLRMHRRVDEVFMSLLSKDRTEVPVLINAVRIETTNGLVNHFAFMVVRQRKKFEDELVKARRTAEDALHRNEELLRIKEELEQSKAALDKHVVRVEQKSREQLEYSTVISHDLNEPMRKIMMFADMLNQTSRDKLDERALKAIERIGEASARMRKLLDVMNEFLIVDASEEEMLPVSLSDLLRRAEAETRDAYPDVPWTLRADTLPTVEGHPKQLQLLFCHLLDNAVRFRDAHRALVVTVNADILQDNRYQALDGKYRYVDHAHMTVMDNGSGFNNRYNEKVFQLFQRLHNNQASLGYGLALCRKIVRNHYGKIAASSSENAGTVITFTLPLTMN